MSFYPCHIGGGVMEGNGDTSTAESFSLRPHGIINVSLVANANAIYIMSDLKDATSFFNTYVNNELKTSSISNIFACGDKWGASVGKLSGNFKKGDVVKFISSNGISSPIEMTIIAITEGE